MCLKNRHTQVEQLISENDHGTVPPKAGRSAQLKKLLKLWSPFERKAVNLAIVKEDNTTTSNSDEAAKVLASSWSKAFAKKEKEKKKKP